MKKDKKKFWAIVSVLVVILLVLLALRPEMEDADVLTIELRSGEISKVSIADLQRFEGIDFENLGDESEVVWLYEGFYERYRASRGDRLLRVFYFNQILEFSGFAGVEYTRLVFHSADGARVMIAPQENRDSLILMALELENGVYTLRLIMPEDSFSQRWLKNVVRIEV